jgi:hypothetical protein
MGMSESTKQIITPDDKTDPELWVEALIIDMPNAEILDKERLKQWFDACLNAGYDMGYYES